MLRQICVCKVQLIFDPPLGDLTAFARLATKLLRYEVELDWKFSKLLLNRKGLNFSQARKVMRNCNPPTLQKHSILFFYRCNNNVNLFVSDNDFAGDEKEKNFACEQIRRSSSSVFPSAAAFLQALLIAFQGRKFIRTFYSTIK